MVLMKSIAVLAISRTSIVICNLLWNKHLFNQCFWCFYRIFLFEKIQDWNMNPAVCQSLCTAETSLFFFFKPKIKSFMPQNQKFFKNEKKLNQMKKCQKKLFFFFFLYGEESRNWKLFGRLTEIRTSRKSIPKYSVVLRMAYEVAVDKLTWSN